MDFGLALAEERQLWGSHALELQHSFVSAEEDSFALDPVALPRFAPPDPRGEEPALPGFESRATTRLRLKELIRERKTLKEQLRQADPSLAEENAAIITRCARFPLIIDPQLQAITWIIGREEKNGLVRMTLGSKGYLDKVIRALEEGLPLLIENMAESIEAVLDNVIARAYIKKGSKIGRASCRERV